MHLGVIASLILGGRHKSFANFNLDTFKGVKEYEFSTIENPAVSDFFNGQDEKKDGELISTAAEEYAIDINVVIGIVYKFVGW